MLLIDFLRHELDLTGTHAGCEHGVCGACTVRVNGEVVRSCIMLAVQADGAEIETVEGLAANGSCIRSRRRSARSTALQCGFCTPGMLLADADAARGEPDPSEAEIREYLSGNICRCTGYVGIVAAVKARPSCSRAGQRHGKA